MNDQETINKMVEAITDIERKNSKDKFNTEQKTKKSIAKEILEKLDEVIKDEDTAD